jgi:hypothetical protein
MGFVREEVGEVTIEERRSAFVIHYVKPWGEVHGEFGYEDVSDIMKALDVMIDDPDGRMSAWAARLSDGDEVMEISERKEPAMIGENTVEMTKAELATELRRANTRADNLEARIITALNHFAQGDLVMMVAALRSAITLPVTMDEDVPPRGD